MVEKPSKPQSVIIFEPIEPLIHEIRNRRVILDADLANVYGVATKVLNQALKRNAERFPPDFAFQLTEMEWSSLRSQIVTSNPSRGGRRYSPRAFTEHGAVMAANVLNSQRAIAMSVYVVRAFVKLGEALASDKDLAQKLEETERKLTTRQELQEKAILSIFRQLKKISGSDSVEKRRPIGFRTPTKKK